MCGRRKCNLGILEWILKSIRGSNNLTLVGSPWLELDLILLLETRVFNAMSVFVLVRVIWSNLCWKWVGLGWAVHFLVHVGSQRTVPNSPLGHSHSIALNWSLCIMLYFMRWSSCAGPHHIGSSHWTREEKNFSLSNYSQLLPLSNRRPLRNSQKFTVSHRNYLATVYVISRFNATQQEWIFCRIKFEVTS